jgi:DNA-binding NarL/FixJ family response regulator
MSKDNKLITVAVVEDNAEVRASLKKILGAAPDMKCVATCSSAEAALADLPALHPAVVLMDINLPGMNGVECVTQLVPRMPGVLIVMLTAHDDTKNIFDSLSAGACGYLHKPVKAAELLEAIKEVYNGGSPMTGNIARKVVQAFSKPNQAKQAASAESNLTDKEHTILEFLAQGYLYKEIAEQMSVSWHTVHTHIRHIYEKLHVRSRSQAVSKFLAQ